MISTHGITPCLWFDNRIEEAVTFYIAVFGGNILHTAHYPEGAPMAKGTVMTITFTLQDQEFIALNGGPHFKFTEAVSFMVRCKDQAEVDRYWNALTADGGEESQCGWLKDKYGFSWQIAPEGMAEFFAGDDVDAINRSMTAMLSMVKIDIAALKAAADGVGV